MQNCCYFSYLIRSPSNVNTKAVVCCKNFFASSRISMKTFLENSRFTKSSHFNLLYSKLVVSRVIQRKKFLNIQSSSLVSSILYSTAVELYRTEYFFLLSFKEKLYRINCCKIIIKYLKSSEEKNQFQNYAPFISTTLVIPSCNIFSV